MSIRQGGKVIAGNTSGRNVGDIFYTMRTDNGLNGAVECDGATYNTTDFTGSGSIGELLESGKLDYVSLSAYSTAISTKGWCDKIGWDGAGNTQFRVPTLNAHIVQTNNIPVVGNGMSIGLTNGTVNGGLDQQTAGNWGLYTATGAYGKNVNTVHAGGTNLTGIIGVTTDGTKSGIIADTTNTSQPRVMIQLAVSATDEAVETCTGVLADVADLKDLSNITASAKEVIAHNAMPSDRYTQLTLGASGSTYTAPADGYFMLYAQYNSGSNTAFDMYSTDGTALGSRHWFGSGDVQAAGRITVPARKNQTFMVTINGTLKNVDFKFVYANGAQ